MGSVTHPQRARDTVDMARIVFGPDFVEENTVVFSLINANSPLVWDATMLGAARAYAEGERNVMMTPFILAGAMSPATVGDVRTDARGVARGHGLRPARPAGRRSSSARSRARCRCNPALPTFGTPEPALVLYAMASLARRLGVPFRSGGALTASNPGRAGGLRVGEHVQPTMLGGTNFVLHAAGWLGQADDGVRSSCSTPTSSACGTRSAKGIDLSEERPGTRRS